MVVGPPLGAFEFQTLGFEIFECCAAIAHKRFAPGLGCRRTVVPYRRIHILHRALEGIGYTIARHEVIVRNPDAAARIGAGAAEFVELFDDQRFKAGILRHQCGADRTHAATDDQHVDSLIPL